MSFRARTFVFDGVPSETYGLFIISQDGAGVIQSSGSNSVNIYTQEIYRNPVPYFYGTQQSPVLTFQLCFASLTPLTALDQNNIFKWLFGHNQYKKLQIMQCDMENIYFNCILNNPTVTYVGNFAYSVSCEVTCDAPWGWEFEKTEKFGPFVSEGTILFNNISDNNYYMFPMIEVKLSENSNRFTLKNTTDNSEISFTDLLSEEIIYIDSQRNIIKSSEGIYRIGNMKGIFPRFVPGINKIELTGGIKYIKITYKNARKVSG